MRMASLALLLTLSGCALWDQTTFQPSPEAEPPPTPAAPPPRVDPRDPLVTIDFTGPRTGFREPLRYAVRAAEARDRAVQFDVIAIVASVEAAPEGERRATEVMRAMLADRVPARRVHLGLRIDPTLTAPRVLVYVR